MERGYREELLPFVTADGRTCNLIHVIGREPARHGPVMLVHGSGVRANIFRSPTDETLVDYLIARGWDVWLENWRASIDVTPNYWTLDEAAVYDHPAAVELVVQKTRARFVRAIIHCQGSTSFMMALAAGLVPQVNVVVSNAVSLHPVVPPWTRFKLRYLLPLLEILLDHLDPSWGKGKPSGVAAAIRLLVEATHPECRNSVCRLASFTYGAGFPALWSHELLGERVHNWMRDEFGFVPMSFFRQMAACVARGRLVPAGVSSAIPPDFLSRFASKARFALVAGARNRVFLPESQARTLAYLRAHSSRNDHSLHIFPEYGHLDVFMGKRAALDTFPIIVDELTRE